jgi:predicted nucleic acid-binding protein
MNILVDASVIISIVIDEPEKETAIKLTKGCTLLSPAMITYEIGNALSRLKKRRILDGDGVVEAYNVYKQIPLRMVEVDMENALKIACKYSIYAYDAYYLETARRLKLPLLTFDGPMKQIGHKLKLEIVEEKSENI